jgi:hypothetical protein
MASIYSMANGTKLVYEMNGSRVVVSKGGKMDKEIFYADGRGWTRHDRALTRHSRAFIERVKSAVRG